MGIGVPYSMYARLKLMAVEYAMSLAPMARPMMKEMKWNALTPRDQPRSSWKEMGYCIVDQYMAPTVGNREEVRTALNSK